MDTWIKFAILIVASYLFSSIPFSYIAARSRGIDLRKQGTQQVGGGNLWRTTSRKLGFFVGIFDLFKGALMVFIAWQLGLDAGHQLIVGLAAVIGHNWPIFLRFHGGRGIATTLGIIIILPIINMNEITTWPLVAFLGMAVGSLIVFRRTPVPILIGLILMPIASAIAKEPLPVTLGYTAISLILIIKRLIAQPSHEKRQIGMGQLLLNRLLFDRDVHNRADWVNRKHAAKKE
jgi:glycerol-3-phosphate acyltransferase PlsY